MVNYIIKKYNINELKKIFPYKENIHYKKLMMTKEATYSVSKNIGSNLLVKQIKKIYKDIKDPHSINITDCTANVGSDSINLGLHFKHVSSIEYDELNYKALDNNIKKIYKLDNVDIYHGNALTILPELKQEIIYMDPPWREKEKWKDLYLTQDNNIDLYIADIYKKFKNNCELFILKIPPEFNIELFTEKIKNKKIIQINIPRNPPESNKSPYLFHYLFIKTSQFPQQTGGNIYYQKYIKYKNKYLTLKNHL